MTVNKTQHVVVTRVKWIPPYVVNDPVNLVDPSGNIPLLALIPAAGGVISGGFSAYDAYQNGGNVLSAFGRGFTAGAAGTLAAIGVTAATGNIYIGGAAGGAVGNLVDTELSGESFDPVNYGTSVVSGAVLGPVAGRILPTKGRLPFLLKPRNSQNFGPNSARLVGQGAISSTIAGSIGAASNSFSSIGARSNSSSSNSNK